MSKLSFRARALDASKPMPVFCSQDIPDLRDFAAINRAVPQMPTGMEKEEECEHHLQRAMSAQQAYGKTGDLVIPTPEVYSCSDAYDTLYISDYKQPRQLIHMQPFAMEQDIPDYDMDSEDERWVNQQAKKMELNAKQFEEMMDRLEKGSGQQVVKLKEAKLLLKEDDDLIIAVYDYWLNKRLRNQHPLIPQVKTEKRDGSTNNNPYVAFRRRTEKMQTRKNRKNDETSYEKMLKLRRDLSRAVTLLEMIKRREKTKREHLHLSIEVFEKRYQAGDYTGQLLQEVTAMRPARPAFVPVHHHSQFPLQRQDSWSNKSSKDAPRKKREYKRRKHKAQTNGQMPSSLLQQYGDMDILYRAPVSSEEESYSAGGSEQEDENDPDGAFSFRRKKHCEYQCPLLNSFANWPWCSSHEAGARINNSYNKYRYSLTSLRQPKTTCVGFARRRVGRGGRILLDRAYTPLDDHWSEMHQPQSSNSHLFNAMDQWPHFWPKVPATNAHRDMNSSDFGDRIVSGVGDLMSTNNQSSNKTSDSSCSMMLNQTLLSCGLENLVSASDSGIVPIELTIESYQSHQEELLKMQRKQQQQDTVHTNSATTTTSQPSANCSAAKQNTTSANVLLDSASAKFAVSALINATQVSKVFNTLSSSSSSAACSSSSTTVSGINVVSPSVRQWSLVNKKHSVLNGPSLHSGLSLESNNLNKATIVNNRLVNNSVTSSTSSSNCHDNRKQLSSLLVDAPSSSTIMTSTSSLSLSSLLSSQPSVPSCHASSGSSPTSTNLSSLLASSNSSTPVSILATRALTPKSTPDLKFSADAPIGSAASTLTENHNEKAHMVKVDGIVSENALPTEVT